MLIKLRLTIIVATLLLVSLLTIACLHKSTPEPQPSSPVQQPLTPTPVPQVPLKRVGLVNDYANVFDPATKEELETLVKSLQNDADVEFAVVTIDSTDGQSIFDYSLALARDWKPGGTSKRGLLFLLAIKQREWRLQVSEALKKDLPDEVCQKLSEPSVALYKEGKYGEGVKLYARAISDRLRSTK